MRAALLIVIAGCGRVAFDPLGADATTDGIAATCADDPMLAACYAFEGDARDATPNANHANATGVIYGDGRVGRAMILDAASVVLVPDSPSLDADVAVTVEAWVRLAAPPVIRSVIVDHNFGYVLFVRETQVGTSMLSTAMISQAHEVSFVIPIGEWHHIAMTFDGAMLSVWIDGALAGARVVTGPISTVNTDGTRIGGNLPDGTQSEPQPLVGAIDEVRVWRVARTAQQLCQSAGTCL